MDTNESIRLVSTTDSPEEVQSALGLAGDEPPRDAEQADTAPADDSQDAPATPPDAQQQEQETEDDGETPPKPTRAQQRIQQLLRERSERDTRIASLEGELKALREPVAPQPASEPPAAPARPDRDQYYSDEEYMDALTDWKLDQRLTAFTSEQETRQAAEREQAEREQAAQAQHERWGTSVQQAREKYEDYDTVLSTYDVPIPPATAEAIQAQERGGELLYHLVQQPEVLAQLGRLTPTQVAFELGAMSARLEPADTPAEPPTPQRRAAPPPPTPVASSTPSQSSQDPSQMNYREFVAWRKRGGGGARR